MLKKLTIYICSLAFCFGTSVTDVYGMDHASVVAVGDSVVAEPSGEEVANNDSYDVPERQTMENDMVQHAGKIDFDPFDYRVQSRYLEKGVPFLSDSIKWFNHLNIYLFSGLPIHGAIGHTDLDKLQRADIGRQFGLGLSYEFTYVHGVRLNYSNITWPKNTNNPGVKNNELMVGYMFNLTNYFKGYNPQKRLHVYSTVTAAMNRTKSPNGSKRTGYHGEFGLLFNYHIWRNFSLFAEPYFGLTTDDYDLVYTPHKYDILGGVRGGLVVNSKSFGDFAQRIADHKNDLYSPQAWFQHFYIGSSYGRMFTDALKVPNTARPIVDSHVFGGYRFNPIQSLRFMATYMKSPEGLMRKHHVMGEIDYVLDFSSMWNGYDPHRHFRVSGYAGAGARYLDMSYGKVPNGMHQYTDRVAPYATVGFDFHYYFTPQLSLFMEPYGAVALPVTDGGQTTMFGGLRGGFQIDFIDTHIYTRRFAKSNDDYVVTQQWKQRPFSHFFFGTSAGVIGEHKNVARNFTGYTYNVFAGYRLTPVQAFRAKATYVKVDEEMDLGKRKRHIEGEIDYMVNFSNLLYGYKQNRWLNVIGYVGFGTKYLEPGVPGQMDDPRVPKLAPMLTSGANVAFRIMPGVSAFVEPYAELVRAKGHHYYTFGYGANAGLAMNLDDANMYGNRMGGERPDSWSSVFWRHFFVGASGGIMGAHIDMDNYLTLPTNIFVGYAISPAQGFRARASYYKTFENMDRDRHLMATIDYMLNLTALLKGYNPNRKLNVLGFAGLGAKYLDNRVDRDGTFAPMANAGLNFSYRIKNGLGVFVEPFLAVAHDKGQSYYTMYYGANAGLGLDLDPVYAYNPRWGHTPDEWKPSFRDRWFMGGSVGWLRTQRQTDKDINPMTMFVGYRFSPNHALRVKVMYNKTKEQMRRRYHLSGAVDYMINMTNLLCDYKEDRPFNFITFVGLGTRYMENIRRYNYEGSMRMYGNVGIDLAYKLTRNVNLFVEPYVGAVRSGNHFDFMDYFMGVNGGLVVNMKDMSKKFEGIKINHSPYFELVNGWMFPTRFGNSIKSSGLSLDARAGLWIDRYLGMRASFVAQNFYYNRHFDNYKDFKNGVSDGYSGAMAIKLRIEGMLNPMNLFHSWEEDEHKFGINLSAGMELGGIGKKYCVGAGQDNYGMYGVTAAAQLMYKATPYISLFVEPRYEYMNAWYLGDIHRFGGQDNDNVITLNAGVRVTRPTAAQRRRNKPTGFSQNFFMGAHVGGYRAIAAYKLEEGGRMGCGFALNLGYHLSELHSVKLMFEPTFYKVKDQDLKYKMKDFRAMYMLNFTNLYQDPADRKVDFYLQAGPGLTTAKCKAIGDSRTSGTLSFGFAAMYHLNRKFSITTEPLGNFFFKKQFMPGQGIRPNMARMRFDVNLGVMYSF